MATTLKNLNTFNTDNLPTITNKKFGIVVSEWNEEVTGKLLTGATDTLLKYGAVANNILISYVPGSFELALGAQRLAEQPDVDAVITLGCVVQGETPHFDYVCAGATQGIMRVGLDCKKPVVFGLLTVLDQQQALDRAGGKHGNKGIEAAATAIKMLAK